MVRKRKTPESKSLLFSNGAQLQAVFRNLTALGSDQLVQVLAFKEICGGLVLCVIFFAPVAQELAAALAAPATAAIAIAALAGDTTTAATERQDHLFTHCAGSLCTRVVSAQLSLKMQTTGRAGGEGQQSREKQRNGTYRLLSDEAVGGRAGHGLGRDGLHLDGLLSWGRHDVGGWLLRVICGEVELLERGQ